MQANAETIRSVVQEVLAQLGKTPKTSAPQRDGEWGVFQSVDQAVAAATEGFKKLSDSPLAARATIIECVRKICDEQAEELGRLEY
jgi:aldehyde dehydrogenase